VAPNEPPPILFWRAARIILCAKIKPVVADSSPIQNRWRYAAGAKFPSRNQ
jgi:hypothetical protein